MHILSLSYSGSRTQRFSTTIWNFMIEHNALPLISTSLITTSLIPKLHSFPLWSFTWLSSKRLPYQNYACVSFSPSSSSSQIMLFHFLCPESNYASISCLFVTPEPHDACNVHEQCTLAVWWCSYHQAYMQLPSYNYNPCREGAPDPLENGLPAAPHSCIQYFQTTTYMVVCNGT
jgi:hypothetical protein